MPHFSFWSWPISFIGTIDEALSKIERIEKNTHWTDKIDKAVWRGTGWFNTVGNKDLRPSLILKGKEKEWADIEALKWNTNGESAENAIGIEDFCKYKFIVYTEVCFPVQSYFPINCCGMCDILPRYWPHGT